jgi:hypothetical protein
MNPAKLQSALRDCPRRGLSLFVLAVPITKRDSPPRGQSLLFSTEQLEPLDLADEEERAGDYNGRGTAL